MSINWVMLSEDKRSFTALPGEQQLYTSPQRTALAIKSLNRQQSSKSVTFNRDSSAGTVFLTNRRIIYLPATTTDQLESFAAPILNCHDAHVSAPFFGPNVWTALVQPVRQGNIPPEVPAVEVKLVFKEGGAFDFHSTYERIKERLQDAVEVAREHGQLSGQDTNEDLVGVNMDTVHLDALPSYEDAAAPQFGAQASRSAPPPGPPAGHEVPLSEPPRYEDVQRQSVAEEVERAVRRQS